MPPVKKNINSAVVYYFTSDIIDSCDETPHSAIIQYEKSSEKLSSNNLNSTVLHILSRRKLDG